MFVIISFHDSRPIACHKQKTNQQNKPQVYNIVVQSYRPTNVRMLQQATYSRFSFQFQLICKIQTHLSAIQCTGAHEISIIQITLKSVLNFSNEAINHCGTVVSFFELKRSNCTVHRCKSSKSSLHITYILCVYLYIYIGISIAPLRTSHIFYSNILLSKVVIVSLKFCLISRVKQQYYYCCTTSGIQIKVNICQDIELFHIQHNFN